MICWLFVMSYAILPAQTQISIQVLIPPPYSPHLTAYIDNPNKVMISLTNTGSTDIEIFLHGKFDCDDGSLVIETFSGT